MWTQAVIDFPDADFYDRRAQQERAMAERAGTADAQTIHLELAERYARLTTPTARPGRPVLSIAIKR